MVSSLGYLFPLPSADRLRLKKKCNITLPPEDDTAVSNVSDNVKPIQPIHDTQDKELFSDEED